MGTAFKTDALQALTEKTLATLQETVDTCAADKAQNPNKAAKFFKVSPLTYEQAEAFIKVLTLAITRVFNTQATVNLLVTAAKFTDDEECSAFQKVGFVFMAVNKASGYQFSQESKTTYSKKNRKFTQKTYFLATSAYKESLLVKVPKDYWISTQPPADWTGWFSQDELGFCLVSKANKNKLSLKSVLATDPADCKGAFEAVNAMQKVPFKCSQATAKALAMVKQVKGSQAFYSTMKSEVFAKLKKQAINKAAYAKKKSAKELAASTEI